MENIEIKALSPDLVEDYLQFFDTTAFSDHQEWSFCYCAFNHFDDEDTQKFIKSGKKDLRNEAESLIKENCLKGYLAYKENNVIGFCNCNSKKNYKRLLARKELWDAESGNIQEKNTKSIVCFIIAPEMRNKGIAAQLLDRACSDAKLEGYSYIEAYPVKNSDNPFENHHGPYKLYEKNGFAIYKEFERDVIMRKIIV